VQIKTIVRTCRFTDTNRDPFRPFRPSAHWFRPRYSHLSRPRIRDLFLRLQKDLPSYAWFLLSSCLQVPMNPSSTLPVFGRGPVSPLPAQPRCCPTPLTQRVSTGNYPEVVTLDVSSILREEIAKAEREVMKDPEVVILGITFTWGLLDRSAMAEAVSPSYTPTLRPFCRCSHLGGPTINTEVILDFLTPHALFAVQHRSTIREDREYAIKFHAQ